MFSLINKNENFWFAGISASLAALFVMALGNVQNDNETVNETKLTQAHKLIALLRFNVSAVFFVTVIAAS